VPGLDDRVVDRALVVVAQPDDAEFWAGGTIPLWTDASTEVTYCVLSDGDAGGFDPAMPRSEIPQIRRAEQAEAAALLGVHDVRFFGLDEGGFREGRRALHVDLVRVIRQVRPQRVVTWGPEWNWQRFRRCHPDHLATGTAVLTAIYPDAGNQFALPQLKEQEDLDAWTVPEVWAGGGSGNGSGDPRPDAVRRGQAP
jgi:LmbE family N-acetylglucosaminyl deacetylase